MLCAAPCGTIDIRGLSLDERRIASSHSRRMPVASGTSRPRPANMCNAFAMYTKVFICASLSQYSVRWRFHFVHVKALQTVQVHAGHGTVRRVRCAVCRMPCVTGTSQGPALEAPPPTPPCGCDRIHTKMSHAFFYTIVTFQRHSSRQSGHALQDALVCGSMV
jgi:hypothetical protein